MSDVKASGSGLVDTLWSGRSWVTIRWVSFAVGWVVSLSSGLVLWSRLYYNPNQRDILITLISAIRVISIHIHVRTLINITKTIKVQNKRLRIDKLYSQVGFIFKLNAWVFFKCMIFKKACEQY